MSLACLFTRHAHRAAPLFALIAAVPLVMVSGAQERGALPLERLGLQALEHIGSYQGLAPAELAIVAKDRARLPMTGVEVAEFKVLSSDGRIFRTAIDAATGQVIDADAVRQQERRARRAKYGVLEPRLYEKLSRNPAQRIPVAIWVAMEDLSPMMRVEGADLNAASGLVRTALTPAAEAVRRLGATVRMADTVPVLFAELNAKQATALAFAGRSDVVAIEEIPQKGGHLSDDAATSNRYVFAWPSVPSAGARATVAIHESDGVDDVNPFLATLEDGQSRSILYWDPLNRYIHWHATAVAGVIASTHNWRRGGASGVRKILSANFQDYQFYSDKVDSATWAIRNGADVINMSWGFCTSGAQDPHSRLVDYLVKTFGRTIVVSAGNGNCVPDEQTPEPVKSPSLAWNVISVGSYFDNNTGSRRDDVLSSFSSWLNPVDPDTGYRYEKPDVLAMGGQKVIYPDGRREWFGVETTSVGGGVNFNWAGTSFAAPDVTALVALIVDKQRELAGQGRQTQDGVWAEVVKATVMAGATHNIIDGLGYDPEGGCFDGATFLEAFEHDCRDGAGAIDARQTISNIVIPANWRFLRSVTPELFGPSGHFDLWQPTYTAGSGSTNFSAGVPARVVIAWDSTAECTNIVLQVATPDCMTDRLNADLDLQILDPYGRVIAYSASSSNSVEVANFTPRVSGTHTIRISSTRFEPGTSTYVGVAWNKDTRDPLSIEDPARSARTIPLNTTIFNLTNDRAPSYWDSYSFDLNPACYFDFEDYRALGQSGPENMYRITTTAPGMITAELSTIRAFAGVNDDLDVFILRGGGGMDQNARAVGCGNTLATAPRQPAGTYYIVVDGFNGSVATFDLSVRFIPSS
jgi:hypothetical protein